MSILIGAWLLALGFGGAYYGYGRWGYGGAGVGVVTMMLVLLTANFLGVAH
jgi:hypothetical protein